jgi:hypothetical protein
MPPKTTGRRAVWRSCSSSTPWIGVTSKLLIQSIYYSWAVVFIFGKLQKEPQTSQFVFIFGKNVTDVVWSSCHTCDTYHNFILFFSFFSASGELLGFRDI